MHAALPGLKVWFDDTGDGGAPVIFLHAGTGNSRGWARQLEAFGSAGYRAIAYDRRGYGKTDAAVGAAAADDLQQLMDHLGLERAHLVGTAAGGIVAFDFALSFPQRVRSLVVANSQGGVQDEEYLQLQRRLRPSPQFEALPPEVRELGPAYRTANPAGTQEWIELERSSRAPGTPTLPKTRNRITFAALATLEAPALLVGGDADLYAPPPVLRMFAARIRNSRSVLIPECGHSAFWEQPELFTKTVLEFIAQY